MNESLQCVLTEFPCGDSTLFSSAARLPSCALLPDRFFLATGCGVVGYVLLDLLLFVSLLLLLEAFPTFSLLVSNCTMMNNSVRVEQEICSNWIVPMMSFVFFFVVGTENDTEMSKEANPIAREPI
jgi:hypothetical protein